MNENIYTIYKSIMKRQPNAINKIETLEDAKLIISMMTGNVYLNSDICQLMNEHEKEEK